MPLKQFWPDVHKLRSSTGREVVDGWGDVLLVVYGLPPVIVLGVALIAKLVARLLGKRLGWWPALGFGVVVLVASLVAYVKYLARTG